MSFRDIIQQIFPIKDLVSVSDKISEYKISYTTTQEGLNIDGLPQWFHNLETSDKVILSVKIYDTLTIDSTAASFDPFIGKVKEDILIVEDEDIEVTFTASKANSKGTVNIYDFTEFNNFFQARTISEVLNLLSPSLIRNNTITFRILYDEVDELYSEQIHFLNASSLPVATPIGKIDSNKIRTNCHFENFSNFPFTAHTFKLIKRPDVQNVIAEKLDRLTFIFYIVGLFDITSIRENIFYSKVNGFKSFEFTDNLDTIDIGSIAEYQKIYEWVYADTSHVTDKIGLVRNILSVHLATNSYAINDNVFTSVNSGFKTYLQNNINKYIDVRGRITDQVNLISQKLNDLAEKYLNNYQKSNFAFISFFISVFLIRVLSAKDTSHLQSVFDRDTTLLFFSLIGVSLLYFLFSLATFVTDIKRLKVKYELLKSRNEDLLDKIDIQKILNNDQEFNSDIGYINKRKHFYTVLWIITILIFVCAVLSLSNLINWSTIFHCTHKK
ncbi:hypothetical protein GCM10027051_35890 [Niabella terrae]